MAPKQEFITGRDCDTWCGKCKLELAHTIVAMVGEWPVHVICNTCGSKHRFKKPKGAAKPRRKTTAAASPRRRAPGLREARVVAAREMTPAELKNRWLDLLAAAPGKEHRLYNVRESFGMDETLRHKKFGVGIVVETMGSDTKVRVLFEEGEKVLVVNYGK